MTTQLPTSETIDRLTEDAIYAFAMLAGMQLDVWTPLRDGPLTAEQIAASLNVQPDKLRPLLHALAAAGLLVMNGERFSNSPDAQRYLVSGEQDSKLNNASFWAHGWSELLGTAESIRTGVPQNRVDYSTATEQELTAAYDRFYPLAEAATFALLKMYDFSTYRRLADVGGGHGALAITMTNACPDLKATVIDFPSVTPFTQRYIDRADMGDRVDVQAADAADQELSGSFDLAMLRSFIQVLTTEQAQQALRNIARVMEPGGAIYIIGAGILDDSMVSPIGAIRFGMSAVNRWDGAQASTESEHRQWLSNAGFEEINREILPSGESVITARKSG